MKTLRIIFSKIICDPGTMFAAGNLILAINVAGTEGIIVSIAVLTLITGLQFYKSVTGRTSFNSLYFTAAANVITAASSYYNTAYLGGETLKGAASAIALVSWAGAHIYLARRDANNGKHGKVLTNPFIYGLIGNIASLQIHGLRVLPTFLVFAAATRSLCNLKEFNASVNNLGELLNKHFTPIKFTTIAFIAGGIQSYLMKDYSYMASQLIWGWAAINLDNVYNKQLMSNVKSAIKPYQK